MVMTKAMRMAMEKIRKSMPSKPMNKNDAARVEAAIRKDPKLYRGLSPHEVLDMLPPKGMTGKVIGMPIKKGKTTKKFVGGALKTIKKVGDAVKKKINKKDSKGNTTSILGKPSANQIKTKKATKKQRTTRREKAKSLAKGVLGTVAAYEGVKGLQGKKSQIPTKKPKLIVLKPKPRPKKNKMYMKEKYTGKDSNVEFAVGKAKKKLFVGGKVGMKSGPATHNRLY
jgi:hypothetical protein